jgi:hypothetical protein
MSYPKWVTRAEDIGPVLCASADEESALLEAWAAEQAALKRRKRAPAPDVVAEPADPAEVI